jgi:hypothetical protein
MEIIIEDIEFIREIISPLQERWTQYSQSASARQPGQPVGPLFPMHGDQPQTAGESATIAESSTAAKAIQQARSGLGSVSSSLTRARSALEQLEQLKK